MPRGSKSTYTSKQKRQAHHIEESAQQRGESPQRAAQIGYATVNKQDGGGKKSGGGRGKASSKTASKTASKTSSRAGGKKSGRSRRGGSSGRAGRAARG